LKIKVLAIGKTEKGWVSEALAIYLDRMKRMMPVEWVELEPAQGQRQDGLLDETRRVMRNVKPGDYLVLLDENGGEFDSLGLATWMNKRMVSVQGDLVFVIGSAYGFHQELKDKAREKLSLSKLTFTHQMVRVIFAEQLYRCFTILRNDPYHHS
jgi:23S rRNA (pseudouridine1915-N3)-methyltransferase